jgi:hypothetical protein
MFAHRLQEVVHFSQQTQRVIYWRSDFSEAFNESFLSDDAGFLLRHMPDAHLKFCLACSHGAPRRLPIPIVLGVGGYPTRPARRMLGMSDGFHDAILFRSLVLRIGTAGPHRF